VNQGFSRVEKLFLWERWLLYLASQRVQRPAQCGDRSGAKDAECGVRRGAQDAECGARSGATTERRGHAHLFKKVGGRIGVFLIAVA